jgi:predicted GIY-YIG superfamily endonuclease
MIKPIDYKDIRCVYMLIQPDGRYYIGSTVNLYTRLRGHKSCFSKKSRDYKKINYTCKWSELSLYILQKVEVSQILKDEEQKYLNIYWSDTILNKELKSKGRSISRTKNPNWLGGRCDKKSCKCGKQIDYRSILCYSCRAKDRHKQNKVDDYKRFLA